MQVDLGYVINVNSPFIDDETQFKNRRGAKFKVELRYYAPFSLHFKRAHHYFSLEPYFNTVRFDRETSVIECFDADCTAQFSRVYDHVVQYRESGVSAKYGIQLYVKKLMFDFSGGLRLRDVYYEKPEFSGIIVDDDLNFIEIDIPDETNRTVVEPVISAKIGYRIR